MPLLSLLSFWPIPVANVYTFDAYKIGVYTLPLTCGTLPGGVLVGTIGWWRPTNHTMVAVSCIFPIFAGLMSTLGPGDLSKALAYSFIYGTAISLLEIAVVILI